MKNGTLPNHNGRSLNYIRVPTNEDRQNLEFLDKYTNKLNELEMQKQQLIKDTSVDREFSPSRLLGLFEKVELLKRKMHRLKPI